MDIEASKSSSIEFFLISWIALKGPMKIGCSFPGLLFSCRHLMESSIWSPMCISKDLPTWSMRALSSLLGLAAFVIASNMSLIGPICGLQLLAYMYFVVVTMPHLSEV